MQCKAGVKCPRQLSTVLIRRPMRALQGDSELLTQTLLCFEEVSSRWFVGAKGVAHGPNTFRPTLSFSWPLVHLFSFFLDGAMEARLALLCFAAGWPGRSMPAGFCSRRRYRCSSTKPSSPLVRIVWTRRDWSECHAHSPHLPPSC